MKPINTLDQATRQQVYDVIEQNAGIHLRGICHLLNRQMGVIQYHVYVLESANLIHSIKDGRYKRFFITTRPLSLERQTILSLLQRKTTAKVIHLLVQHNGNGISRGLIAQELNFTIQAITWHLQKLMDANVISLLKTNGKNYYHITPTFLPMIESYEK